MFALGAPLRYSDKPIEAYGQLVDGEHRGPAALSLLREDLQAWNLTYLSFDFEANPSIPPPEFMYLLARTLRTDLESGIVCSTSELLAHEATIRPLLQRSPRGFAMALLAHPRVRELPLYKGFGEAWLSRVFERSCLACEATEESPGMRGSEESGLQLTNSILKIFAAARP